MNVTTLAGKTTENAGYIVRPNYEEKFRSNKVNEILYACISEVLGDKKFEQEQCPEWTKQSKIHFEFLFISLPIDRERSMKSSFDRDGIDQSIFF